MDYDSFSASLTFGPGNDQQILCRTLLTREDTFVESTETLTIVLETSAAGVTFSPGSATVFIADNDIAPPSKKKTLYVFSHTVAPLHTHTYLLLL